jgi:hypothetical protein
MDFITPELITGLIEKAWQGGITVMILRWVYLARKAKKNGNGQFKRLTDVLPGNPGHSPYEIINDRLDGFEHRIKRTEDEVKQLGDGFEHRLERTEDEVKQLGLSIARMEVRTEKKEGG